MTSRTIPFRAVTVPISNGSDPDVIEIDDCTNVYQMFPEIERPCDKSPVGECEYNALGDPDICIHCRKATGA